VESLSIILWLEGEPKPKFGALALAFLTDPAIVPSVGDVIHLTGPSTNMGDLVVIERRFSIQEHGDSGTSAVFAEILVR
jgi:hypothetical protein